MASLNQSEQQFHNLTKFGGSLGLGTMFALFASIESVNPKIVFSLNWLVPVAFFGGGGMVWWVLGRIFATANESGTDGKRNHRTLFWMLLFCLLLAGLTIAGFASALHGTSTPRLRDVFIGNSLAVWALALCGLLLWQFIQYFEENSAEAEKKFNREHGIEDPSDPRVP